MGIMASMEKHKEFITAWIAIIGVAGSAAKYFYDLDREKTAINIAVLTEVHRLLPVIRSHRKWWNCLPETDKERLPLIPFSTPVFNGQVQQIGKLEKNVVGSVGAFYGYLGYINQLQTSRKAYLDAGRPARFKEQYLQSLDNILRDYDSEFDAQFKQLELGPWKTGNLDCSYSS
jgi:hypothetical protein